jgi:16S rRNA (guanine527-N7)-methyltransferase
MLLNGKAVSRETQERLTHFVSLVTKWQKSINLIAPSTLGEIWSRHIEDSAQIFSLSPGPHRWLDLGSGAGFPGVVTAILLAEQSNGWVHLIESNLKKAAFLRVALAETGARGSVHPDRVESLPTAVPQCDRISARALADLDLLLEYTAPWMVGTETRAFFHKGRDYQQEVEKAHGRWSFDLVKHSSVVERESVVLEISQLRHQHCQM